MVLAAAPAPKTVTRVLVIGTLPGQAERLTRRWEKSGVRLTCVPANRPGLPGGPVDHVIVWIRFLGHRWSEAALKLYPRDRVHLHAGGLTRMNRLIENLAR